jgi:hypothetical protein
MKSPKPLPEARPATQASASASSPKDIALIHGVTPDGGLRIIRRRGDTLEAGAVHPIKEGAPIHGEVVCLKPRPECPVVCDVEVQYAPPRQVPAEAVARAMPAPSAPSRKGPAQVATEAYRDNWDSIWSSSKKKRDALN